MSIIGRNIDEMHEVYGVVGNKTCDECKNLLMIKGFPKCKIFGIDGTYKTNWKNNLIACGMFSEKFI